MVVVSRQLDPNEGRFAPGRSTTAEASPFPPCRFAVHKASRTGRSEEFRPSHSAWRTGYDTIEGRKYVARGEGGWGDSNADVRTTQAKIPSKKTPLKKTPVVKILILPKKYHEAILVR